MKLVLTWIPYVKAITPGNNMTILYAAIDLILSIDREILVMIISYPVLTWLFELWGVK